MIRIESLTFTYAGAERPALSGVNLTIREGSFTVLCGTTGSGKSTLLRHLKPEITPHGQREGSVLYRARDLRSWDPLTTAAQVGFVMQDPDAQIVTDKVWHELAFGLENLETESGVIRRRVAEMASFFGIESWFRHSCATLSSGQKQTLALAAVMVMQPDLLVLDEPTAQLDPIAAYEFLGLLERIHREIGTTIVIAEHRLEESLPLADQAIVMDAGRIVCAAPPARIGLLLPQAAAGQSAALRRMTAGLPAATQVAMAAVTDPARAADPTATLPLTPREGQLWLAQWPLPAAAVGDAKADSARIKTDRAKPVLSARELWFRYDREDADILRGLSLDLTPGSIHAVLGGNGTGKSTLLAVLRGIYQPRRGQVRLADSGRAGAAQHATGMVLLGVDPRALFVRETVRQELTETLSGRPGAAAQMTALFGLEPLLPRHPMDLSSGEGQKVALALAIGLDPEILLLDEPTRGLDPATRETLRDVLRGIAARGHTVLMVTHDVEFAAVTADVCSLLFDGEVVSSGAPAQFFAGNRFYTTAANRMARAWRSTLVTVADILAHWQIGDTAERRDE